MSQHHQTSSIERSCRTNTEVLDMAEKNIPCDYYIHMVNSDDPPTEDTLRKIASIAGEICVSLPGDRYLSNGEYNWGIVFAGEVSYLFPFDCYSEIDSSGLRYCTSEGSPYRHEGWLVPRDSKVVGIITDDDAIGEYFRSLGYVVFSTNGLDCKPIVSYDGSELTDEQLEAALLAQLWAVGRIVWDGNNMGFDVRGELSVECKSNGGRWNVSINRYFTTSGYYNTIRKASGKDLRKILTQLMVGLV